jgi:hypothetical protein
MQLGVGLLLAFSLPGNSWAARQANTATHHRHNTGGTYYTSQSKQEARAGSTAQLRSPASAFAPCSAMLLPPTSSSLRERLSLMDAASCVRGEIQEEGGRGGGGETGMEAEREVSRQG